MDAQTVTDWIADITYKPNWNFQVESVDGDVLVMRFGYIVPNSNKNLAPDYFLTGEVWTYWPLHLSDIRTKNQFQMLVISAIVEVEMHELREFIAFDRETFEKPVHPHSDAGSRNWAGMHTPNPLEQEVHILNDALYGLADRESAMFEYLTQDIR